MCVCVLRGKKLPKIKTIMNSELSEQIAIQRVLQTLVRIQAMIADKRVTNMGSLKVLVYIYCSMFNIQGDACVRTLFNKLCKMLNMAPGTSWRDVARVGETFVNVHKKNEREEIEKELRSNKMVSSLMGGIVSAARIAAERRLAHKKESRVTVDAEGWYFIPIRRRLRGTGEEVKCVVWGVSEKKFTEADVKGLCLEMGMDVVVNIVRVGREKGRRVEVICSSESVRDKCIEKLDRVP